MGERKGERAAGERGARPAATYQRIIIVIRLGGLDLAVPPRERKKGRNENYGKMRGETRRRRGAMEQRGVEVGGTRGAERKE